MSAKIEQLRKANEFMQFVAWTALPSTIRQPITQKELAQELGVEEATLSDWKNVDGFWDEVRDCIRIWAKNRTPDVINGLFQRAAKQGDPAAAKLWLQVFDEFKETSVIEDKRKDVLAEYGIGDDNGGQADDSVKGSSENTA